MSPHTKKSPKMSSSWCTSRSKSSPPQTWLITPWIMPMKCLLHDTRASSSPRSSFLLFEAKQSASSFSQTMELEKLCSWEPRLRCWHYREKAKLIPQKFQKTFASSSSWKSNPCLSRPSKCLLREFKILRSSSWNRKVFLFKVDSLILKINPLSILNFFDSIRNYLTTPL